MAILVLEAEHQPGEDREAEHVDQEDPVLQPREEGVHVGVHLQLRPSTHPYDAR